MSHFVVKAWKCDCIKDVKDTTRKQTDSKLSPNADTTTKTNGSTSSSNNAPTTSPTTTITSSSSSSVNQKVNQCSPNQPTPPQFQNGSGSSDPVSPSPDIRKPSPMAFTVDLDSVNSDSSTSGNSAKKLNISASISQWALNTSEIFSLTKVEDIVRFSFYLFLINVLFLL
ncbi:hypothetical protein Avbf_07215 [Armadillidium vulgare]|nr:hypothetical protein Avbf_07215 [Armadillidium vulgare]